MLDLELKLTIISFIKEIFCQLREHVPHAFPKPKGNTFKCLLFANNLNAQFLCNVADMAKDIQIFSLPRQSLVLGVQSVIQ